MKHPRFTHRFWLFAGVALGVLTLPSCRTTSSAPHAWSYSAGGTTMTAEDLLDSQGGPYTMVEQEDESPTALHDLAKKEQNPRDMNSPAHKGADYDIASKSDDSYSRVVRLVKNGEAPPPMDVAGMMPAKTDLIMDSGMTPPEPARKPDTQVAQVDVPKPHAKPRLKEISEQTAYVPVPQEKPRMMAQPEQMAIVDVPEPAQKPRYKQARAERSELPPVSNNDQGADTGAVEISALRFGTHPDKVRMVFDVSGPATFQHQLDNRTHTLSIEIPDTQWRAGKSAETLKSPLVQGYTTSHEGTTTLVELTLKKPIKVIWAASLKPENDKGNRLVLDLAAL